MASAFNPGILAHMNQGSRKGRFVAGLGLFTLVLHFSLAARAADSLDWRKDKDSVDADISSWSLLKTLETISEATGWQVYVEPGTQKKVSTKFKDRPRDRALDLLLGNLGRAFLPGTNGGPPRFLVFRTHQKEATQLISKVRDSGDPTKVPIPDELIVTLKPCENIDTLSKKIGANVLGRNGAFNAYRLKFESPEAADTARAALAQNPCVESVESNYYVRRPEDGENVSALNALNSGGINLEPKAPSCGSVPTIGLIDTAVQKTGAAYDALVLPTVSVAEETGTQTEQPLHGTAMAEGILQALSKKQNKTEWRVRPYDVYGKNEKTTTFDVANGISRAITDGANPINMSLGGGGDSELLHKVIQSGHKQGILFLAAAGNEPTTDPTYPGAYPEVVAVSSVGADGKLAPYANRGDFVDVLAPGQIRITFNGQTWITSGTSVSTALVSGIIAGGVNGGCVTGDQLRAALQSLLGSQGR